MSMHKIVDEFMNYKVPQISRDELLEYSKKVQPKTFDLAVKLSGAKLVDGGYYKDDVERIKEIFFRLMNARMLRHIRNRCMEVDQAFERRTRMFAYRLNEAGYLPDENLPQ